MKIIAKTILLIEIFIFSWIFFSKLSFLSPKRTLDFSGTKTLTINDDGFQYKIITEAISVNEALAKNNVSLGEGDELFPQGNTEILPGMKIFINRPAKVQILVDGETKEKLSFVKTVSDVILENNITLSHLDRVEPPPETNLNNDLMIVITRIKTEQVAEEETIEFSKIEQKDNKIDWGEKVVTQKGEEGIREIIYKIDYENGKQVKKTKLNSKIISSPKPEITKIGTKINFGKSESGVASWYNTETGKCASRNFPRGTWLRVTSRENGKQIFIQVEGYGPQEGTGKIIDLDNKAFKQLAPLGEGTLRVKVEEILNKNFKP